MGKRTKTRKAYRINQRKQYHNTGIELTVRDLLKSVGYTTQRYYVKIGYDEDGRHYDFEPDIEIPPNIIIEVDGHPSHFTSRGQQKMKWRDKALAKLGKRIIHVDGKLLRTKELQMYAVRELQKAIESSEPIIRIDG